MDKKKLVISGLTLAGFLATTAAPLTNAFAGDKPAKEKKEEKKNGSCAGGSCGAMHDKEKKEEAKGKEGSCGGMKDKEKKSEKKEGSCTAMK